MLGSTALLVADKPPAPIYVCSWGGDGSWRDDARLRIDLLDDSRQYIVIVLTISTL